MHGPARVARWKGQTAGASALSVAEDFLIVEEIAGLLQPCLGCGPRLAALLHDAHEYVAGDRISPFERAPGGDMRSVEGHLQQAMPVLFGSHPVRASRARWLFHGTDRAAAHMEAVGVGAYRPSEAVRIWRTLAFGIEYAGAK